MLYNSSSAIYKLATQPNTSVRTVATDLIIGQIKIFSLQFQASSSALGFRLSVAIYLCLQLRALARMKMRFFIILFMVNWWCLVSSEAESKLVANYR